MKTNPTTKNAEYTKLLKDIELYINALKSISGTFNQSSSNGAKESGIFYIKKPGRMRLEYQSPMLLVADGTSIVYFDKKLDQISYIALDSNPASIILTGNIVLTGKTPTVKIKNMKEINGILHITLSFPHEKQSGVITLLFHKKPLSLIGWEVKDPQGITTTITLSNIKPEANLSESLFKISRTKSPKSKSKYY